MLASLPFHIFEEGGKSGPDKGNNVSGSVNKPKWEFVSPKKKTRNKNLAKIKLMLKNTKMRFDAHVKLLSPFSQGLFS